MKWLLMILMTVLLTVANPGYALAWLVFCGVIWAFNRLIELHDKYLL